MKIQIGQVANYEELITKLREKTNGQDASTFSLRADRNGNLWMTNKDGFFRRHFLRSGEMQRAASKVTGLIESGIRDRHTRSSRFTPGSLNKGNQAGTTGGAILADAGIVRSELKTLRGYVMEPIGKLPVSGFLSDKLRDDVAKVFTYAEQLEKWKGYNGENPVKRQAYLKTALTTDETTGPEGPYQKLCSPGASTRVKSNELFENSTGRPIEFTPSPEGGADVTPYFQLSTPEVNNRPKLQYSEPSAPDKPISHNRAHSFDKFRISVHPEDLEKAFAIVWKHIGKDMATSEKPSIFAFKVHDVQKHDRQGKTFKDHQFTLYLPLPDSVADIYGEKTEKNGTNVLTGEDVNNAQCSDEQAMAFCNLMKGIEADLREAGIRPNERNEGDFNTDYNIPGSNYFSMRNEVLNDRDTSRTLDENQVLSERQLPSMLTRLLQID